MPVYLKKAYKDDPIFSSSKIVLSLYDDTPQCSFDPAFAEKACFGGVGPEDLRLLKDANGINLARTAAQYSDGIILGAKDVDSDVCSWCRDLGLPILPYNEASLKDGSYVDEYCSFYDEL